MVVQKFTKELYFTMKYSIFIVLILVLSLSVGSSFSQEFFPNDFAKGTAGEKVDSFKQASPISPNPENKLAGVSPFRDRILAIVFVNSINKQHFDQVITRILTVQRQGKIRIVSVAHIGDYRNVDKKQIEALKHVGIIFGAVSELPQGLPADTSPVWGVMTPESRKKKAAYIIQGYLEPELFFNQAGNFEIPAGMQVADDTSKEGKLGEF